MQGKVQCLKNEVKQHKWSDEEKEYLKEITPGRHYTEIHEMMNDKFEYEFRLSQVIGAIKRYNLLTGFDGKFEKGRIPFNKGTRGYMRWNKTSFKTGNIPKNKKEVGSERINVDGYHEIKVAEPNKWRFKHRVMYERYHDIKLNPNQVVIFADGDKNNLSETNLVLITRKQLLIMNTNKLIKKDAESTKVGVNIARLTEKINEVTNRGEK